jgi:SAM-dependent methyltransferase
MRQVRWQTVAKGLGTYLPVVRRFANSAAGSPVGARYYYSVWLRHLASVAALRPAFRYDVVAELGPGDGLGIGLCALLSGAKRYIGLDRVAFVLRADSGHLVDELLALFTRREPIPGEDEFPDVYPKLADYSFPDHVLTNDALEASLAPQRIELLRQALRGSMAIADDAILSYAAPWDASDMVRPSSVDLLVSQAVMEHVDDVDAAYSAMRRWLKPQGMMSHRIDYTSHGITLDWYGHWTVSPTLWRVVRGKRSYLINRLPHSAHLNALKRNGFEILDCSESFAKSRAPAEAMRVVHNESDLAISGAYLVAQPAIQ